VEERTDKGMDQKEKRKRNDEIGGRIASEDTVAYKEILRMNCETLEEILTAIGPVITKTADRKTIMNYHTRGRTRKTIML